jgi:hypothetical protein
MTHAPIRPDVEALRVARNRMYDDLESARLYGGAFGAHVAGMEGIGDVISWLSDSARAKWTAAIAQLRSYAGPFFALRPQLEAARVKLARAAERAGKDPRIPKATADQVSALQSQNATLRSEQGRLELKVRSLLEKVGFIEAGQAPPGGLGIEPVTIVIGLSAIAAITVVVGAMVIHTQRAREHLRQMELLAAGLITPAQLSEMREDEKTAFDPFGVAGMGKSLALVAVVAAALFFIPKPRRAA